MQPKKRMLLHPVTQPMRIWEQAAVSSVRFWFKFLIFLLVIGGAAYLTTVAFVQTASSQT